MSSFWNIILIAAIVFWILGVERFLLPGLSIYVAWNYLATRDIAIAKLVKPMHFFAVFLVAYAFSGLAIEESPRLITFFWDLYIYVAFFVLVYATYVGARDAEDLNKLLIRILLFSVLCQLIASTYFIFGNWSYPTPGGTLLPESVKETAIGKSVAIRSVGRELWLLGLSDRLKSIFSSSIHFGSFLFLTIPLLTYLIVTGGPKNRLLAWLLTISTAAFLIMSQSRTAIVLAIIMFPLLLVSVRFAKSPAFDPGTFSILFVSILLVALTLATASYTLLEATFNEVFLESRAASFEQRYGVYTQSLARLADSLLLGHGTQIDVEDIRLPLGSHNWFLAILFKHGLLGFIPFVLFIGSVLWRGLDAMFRKQAGSNVRALLVALLIGYPFFLFLCLTIEPTVDVLDVTGLAAYIGMFLAIGRIAGRTFRWRAKATGKVGQALPRIAASSIHVSQEHEKKSAG